MTVANEESPRQRREARGDPVECEDGRLVIRSTITSAERYSAGNAWGPPRCAAVLDDAVDLADDGRLATDLRHHVALRHVLPVVQAGATACGNAASAIALRGLPRAWRACRSSGAAMLSSYVNSGRHWLPRPIASARSSHTRH